jgi:hypothetical protein
MGHSRTRPPSSRVLDAAATTMTRVSFASSMPLRAKAPASRDWWLISPATGSQPATARRPQTACSLGNRRVPAPAAPRLSPG